MTSSDHDPTFQAHELVYCAKCFLPYDQRVNITEVDIPEDASNRSWYLTNCGHALCSQCLFPNGLPSTIDSNSIFPCPKCQFSATIVGLAAELPPEILPYFRSVTEMSEEVLGAIKFQHQNLLHLVDHLRGRLEPMTNIIKQARDELEKRKDDQARIVDLENTIAELRKKLEDRETMPPPALPTTNKGSTRTKSIGHPVTPANFRSDLAARPVTGLPLRPTRQTAVSPLNADVHQPSSSNNKYSPNKPEYSLTSSRNFPPAQVTEFTTDQASHQHYQASLQSHQYPPSTPQKPPPFQFGLSTPQQHTFTFDPYNQQSSQRTPFHTQRTATVPTELRPSESYHPPSSGYFSPEHIRPRQISSARVSASAGRDSPIPVGPMTKTTKSPYSRVVQGRLGVVNGRGRGVSPIRTRNGGDGGFVARLNAHGGRR